MTTLPGQPLAHSRLASDRPLAKPASMTDAECGTLHVRDKTYSQTPGRYYHEFLSRWTPTNDQRALVAAGHDLYLSVVGSHPPVLVYAGDPDGLDSVAHHHPSVPLPDGSGLETRPESDRPSSPPGPKPGAAYYDAISANSDPALRSCVSVLDALRDLRRAVEEFATHTPELQFQLDRSAVVLGRGY